MADRNTVLVHVYGIGGVVPGLISIFALVKIAAPWREYALVGSGWLAAFIFVLVLFRSMNAARQDGDIIAGLRAREAQLMEERAALKAQLKQRSATADFLASLLLGQRATPRMGSDPHAQLANAAPAAPPAAPHPAAPHRGPND